MSKYKQGQYKVLNVSKYKGDADKVFYRSGWELKVFKWLDTELNVTLWSSEEIIIPYVSPVDNRYHRYFPDAWAVMKTSKGVRTFLIEIKPYKQTQPPKKPKKQTKRFIEEVCTYGVNQAKWAAAEKYCEEKGWTFKVITEREIKV